MSLSIPDKKKQKKLFRNEPLPSARRELHPALHLDHGELLSFFFFFEIVTFLAANKGGKRCSKKTHSLDLFNFFKKKKKKKRPSP